MEAPGVRKLTFSQISFKYHFFELQCELFVRIFLLNKVYRRENPSGYQYLRKKTFPEMDSNQNSSV